MTGKDKKVQVDAEDNKVTVVLDTRFYRSNSVRSSAEDFKNCCLVELEHIGNRVSVVLSPKSKEIDLNTVGYEFCNYVLGRMRSDESRF